MRRGSTQLYAALLAFITPKDALVGVTSDILGGSNALKEMQRDSGYKQKAETLKALVERRAMADRIVALMES